MPDQTDSRSTAIEADLSIVIPFFNDEGLVMPLYNRLKEVFEDDKRYEFILIDDGSSDKTFEKLRALSIEDNRFRAIRFKKNYGQRVAITAGIRAAKGKMVATMDPDLQNDPGNILNLAALLTDDIELANGYRESRHESLAGRRIPSFITNKLLSFVSGVKMKDFGSPMAVFDVELIKKTLNFSPNGLFSKTLASMLARDVKDSPISHKRRSAGHSSYNFMRLLKMFHLLFFSALELRLTLMGFSPAMIKNGLIAALFFTIAVFFASIIMAPSQEILFVILFLLTLLFLSSLALSIRNNIRLKKETNPLEKLFLMIE